MKKKPVEVGDDTDATPRTRASELRVRMDATPAGAWDPADTAVDDATPTPEHHARTREAGPDAGPDGYASHVSEIRRLYAEGEVEAALDLASMVRPSTMAFSLQAVPVVALTPQEVLALPLDARSGFLLARIDGTSTLQTLLDVSAMPAVDAMALLEELLALGAVRLLPPPNADP
jgi:hypothetical protein